MKEKDALDAHIAKAKKEQADEEALDGLMESIKAAFITVVGRLKSVGKMEELRVGYKAPVRSEDAEAKGSWVGIGKASDIARDGDLTQIILAGLTTWWSRRSQRTASECHGNTATHKILAMEGDCRWTSANSL